MLAGVQVDSAFVANPSVNIRSNLLLAEKSQRVRVLTAVSVIFVGMSPIFVYRYYQMGIPRLALAVAAAACLAAAVVIWARRRDESLKGGAIVTATLLLLLVYSNYCSGGIGNPNFGWLYVIPMLGALLGNARLGWGYTGIVFLLTVFFFLAPEYGFEIPNYVPEELRAQQGLFNRLSAVVAIGVILGALASQQGHFRSLLERINNELTYEMNQRSEMQARMVRTERAASMGSLAAGMAHEINNPLTYVIGNLELLQAGQASAETEERESTEDEEMLSEAMEGAYRVAALVRDLKTFSHSGEEKIEPIDLGKAIDRATKMTSNEIRHRAQLEVECPPGILILGNRGRILQVLINLLTNAAHAIEPGFSESNFIRVTVQRREGRVLLEVTDSGSGIQPEIADRIFEPFVTTKGVGFGMGMGLSITRNVLQGMGGTIEVAYSSPEGTTFGLTLQPYEQESEEAPDSYAEAEAVSGREDSRLNVLIIDDEERVLAYLKNALSHHDVSVEIDGRKAVDRASTGDFDIVLCDLMMPRMSGMEVYSELKERSPNVASRMLFMTGGVFAEKVAEFLETLPGRWIEKPINFGELESRIWSMIEAIEGSKAPASEASTGGGA